MAWRPSQLTREQMEERRKRGWELLGEGWRGSNIADELGVSEAAVSQWRQQWEEGGGCASVPSSGRPPKLSILQKWQLNSMLRKTTPAQHYIQSHNNSWTGPAVAELILQKFGITYHPNYISRLVGGIAESEELI